MKFGKKEVLQNRIFSRLNFSKTSKESLEYSFWKISVGRNCLQTVLFILAIYLPWYRFYRPRGNIVVDAGAFDLGGQTIGLLLFAAFISFVEVGWLIFQHNRKVTTTKIFDIANIFPCFILLSLIGDPVFKPGLGGIYSGYIHLYILNWAGFKIIPMIGYLFVIVAIASVLLGSFLVIFSP